MSRRPSGDYVNPLPPEIRPRSLSYSSQGSLTSQSVSEDEFAGPGAPPVMGSPYSSPYASPYPSLLEPDADKADEEAVKRRNTCFVMWGFFLAVIGIAVLSLTVAVLPDLVNTHNNNVRAHLADRIADMYVPSFNTPAFAQWAQNDLPNQGKTYDIVWMYNVSNADDVLFHRALPIVTQLLNPFIFWRREERVACTVPSPGKVKFKKFVRYEKVVGPVTFHNMDGSVTTYEGIDPDRTYIRTVNADLAGALTQISRNPFQDPVMKGWQDFCKSRPTLTIMQCIDEYLVNHTDSATDLNGTFTNYSSHEVGILPLRTASRWLGLTTPGPSTQLWVYLDDFVRRATLNESWAYFTNHSWTEANAKSSAIQPEQRNFNRADLEHAMTYDEWAGVPVLHDMAHTYSSGKWNILNFNQKFAGWGLALTIQGANFHDTDRIRPHISLSTYPTFSVWDPLMGRSLSFTGALPSTVRGVASLRYTLDRRNYELVPSNKRFFASVDGLANVTQLSNYNPIFFSNPHFYQFNAELNSHNPSLILKGVPPPNPETDTYFIDVEPHSGMVINKAMRYQMNTWMPALDFAGTSVRYNMNQTSLLYPVLILDRRFQISSSQATALLSFDNPVSSGREYYILGGVVGGVLVLFGVYLLTSGVRRRMAAQADKKPIYAGTTSSALIYDSMR